MGIETTFKETRLNNKDITTSCVINMVTQSRPSASHQPKLYFFFWMFFGRARSFRSFFNHPARRFYMDTPQAPLGSFFSQDFDKLENNPLKRKLALIISPVPKLDDTKKFTKYLQQHDVTFSRVKKVSGMTTAEVTFEVEEQKTAFLAKLPTLQDRFGNSFQAKGIP